MISSDYHVIFCPGVSLFVDAGVRREVERWLSGQGSTGGNETLDVVSIYDEEVTLVRGMVITIASSTPKSRRLDREHGKLLQEEIPLEDRA